MSADLIGYDWGRAGSRVWAHKKAGRKMDKRRVGSDGDRGPVLRFDGGWGSASGTVEDVLGALSFARASGYGTVPTYMCINVSDRVLNLLRVYSGVFFLRRTNRNRSFWS